MKRLVIVLGALLLTISSYAQSPEKFSYQAVVRNSADELVINSTTPIKVSILKTDASGTVVYEEAHAPTTNANGLLSIEIGQGTVQSGALDMIDWGTDTYYIKTEIDVDNNASYDITGTSQLLSVPYALNANTLTGGIDKAHVDSLTAIIGTSEAKIVVLETDMANMEASLVVLDTQISTAETDIAALEAENITLETRIAALETLTAASAVVGDYRDGGVVFWVDPTDDKHGLVCSITNQGLSNIEWGCVGVEITGADGTAIGTGAANTAAIEAQCTTAGTAADIAANLTLNGYDDWFLPSKDELNEIYINRVIINETSAANGGATGFFNHNFWSSTHLSANAAWRSQFSDGIQGGAYKTNFHGVRAVRAF